ncbi:hypothetical protein, partial [Enterobacter hormaechei]
KIYFFFIFFFCFLENMIIYGRGSPHWFNKKKNFSLLWCWFLEHGCIFFIGLVWGAATPPPPQFLKLTRARMVGVFFFYTRQAGGQPPPRLGFDNWRQPVG